MDYTELTGPQRDTIRRQRTLDLESEHYRLELLLAEITDPEQIVALAAQQAEVTRRIGLHADVPDQEPSQV